MIFGLDGACWPIINYAVDNGYMPFTKSLIEKGSSGILKSTIPSITPAAWSSFQTGMNPGENGVFDFAYFDRMDKEVKYVGSQTLSETLWEICSRNNRKVCAINVPMTYPPREVNGFVVTGIMTPDTESDFTWPPELKKEILERFTDYHIFNLYNIKKLQPHRDPAAFIGHMRDIVVRRADLAEYLLTKDRFDLFMVHFQATDVVQHALWNLISNPGAHDENTDMVFREFYRRIDNGIKRITEKFREGVSGESGVFVISDHGFETHKKRVNLGLWLYQKGLLIKYPETKPPILKRLTRAIGAGKLLGRVLGGKRAKMLEKRVFMPQRSVDMEHSKAFAFGRSGEGYIYLLSEDKGQKKKDFDYIFRELMELKDPETSIGIVERIYAKEEIYHGPYMERMPDMIIVGRPGYSFSGALDLKMPLFHVVNAEDDFHIGKHDRNGILIACGGHIKPGQTLQADLIDMTPTLLFYLGLALKDDFDGKVINSLFIENIGAADTACDKPGQRDNARNEHLKRFLSKNEENKIEQRLRDLGYL